VSVRILVMGKEPGPGISKTRLCPPCTPMEAAAVARAALEDTLETVAATPAVSRTVVLEGNVGDWLPPGLGVVRQRGDGLAERLAAAFEDCPAPAILIGMDTPQIRTSDLARAAARLMTPGIDAVLGPTPDGGYWIIGLKNNVTGLFEGVPMSTDRTCREQLHRFQELGVTCALLPSLRDIDYWDDAQAVMRAIPNSRLARTVARIEHEMVEASA
jgi:uncharacterized protein